jgi:hypothetical protein
VAVLRPRERLVYFRVSEDEFRQFSTVCEQTGARSMSDLVRNAVQGFIADGQRQRQAEALDEKMRVLEDLIAAVTEQLRLLSASPREDARLGTLNGAGELNSGIPHPVAKGGQQE